MLRFAAAALLTTLLALPAFSRDDDAPAADFEAKALKLNSLTSLEEMQKKLTAILKNKASARKLLDAALKLNEAGGEKSPFKFNAGLVLGKVAVNLRDTKAAAIFYEVGFENAAKLQSGKKLLDIVSPYVTTLWSLKKFDKAEDAIKKTLDLGGEEAEQAQVFLTVLLAGTKAKQGNADEALNLIDALVAAEKASKDGGGFEILTQKAILLSDLGKNDDALATMLEVVELAKKAKKIGRQQRARIVQQLEYQLTSYYVDAKQIDKAVEILKRLVEAEPEVATYQNDLGFIMADNDLELEASEKLIRKALELDEAKLKKDFDDGKIDEAQSEEQNSSYLDSLGWVLYKRGKYEEARKLLLKASRDENQGAHLEIWDHLADCLVKLNKKDEAVKAWTEALTFEDSSRRDAERRKKVEAKLKALKAELKK